MKYYALIALLMVSVFVLIGCTGCDSNPGTTTVDLSTDRSILCNDLGWTAQEDDYTVLSWDGSDRNITFLDFTDNTDSNGTIECKLYEAYEGYGNSIELSNGLVEIGNDTVAVETGFYGRYSIRITANSEDSEPVLTLTAISDDAPIDKMYFSLAGGA